MLAAAQCIVIIGPVCVFATGGVCVCVCGSVNHDNSKLREGKGVCGRAEIFGFALLQSARSVCVSLSAFFIDPSDARNMGGILWRPPAQLVMTAALCVNLSV